VLTFWIGIVLRCCFWCRFASNPDYFVALLHFNLVISRCFTSALFGGELCALKRRLQAKLLALELCILAAHWQHLLDI